MRVEINEEYESILMLVCMFKMFYDSGNTRYIRWCENDNINDFDYYYDFVYEAVQSAAPIVINSEGLYKKHGYTEFEDEINIWAYSSKEMQEYYKLAQKLHRTEGCKTKENPYIREIEQEIEDIRNFYSYSFDYFIGNKRKGAQLEILWSYEFTEEAAMCIWIIRVINLFKKRLPKLRKKYISARRAKRSRKGGVCNA